MTKIEMTGYLPQLAEKETQLLLAIQDRAVIAIEKVPDILDHISGSNDREVFITTLNNNADTLAKVQAAMYRIGDGTFGVCLHCEDEISKKRLKAVPWAEFCLECQEMVDDAMKNGITEPFELDKAV